VGSAAECAESARRIKRLDDALAENLSDGVGVKDAEGRYVLVSPGLGRALGSPAAAIVGRTDAEIRTGTSPAAAAEHDAALAPPVLPVAAGSGLVTIPVERAGQTASMALVVTRAAPSPAGHPDVPRINLKAAGSRQARQLIDGAVAAMVRAVELRDPFLLGHTERVTELALAIGRELGLSEDDLETLGLAARLCQIGKIFMADSILSKPGRHTAEETLIMGQHVRHALEVLEPVGLEAAVTNALAHMHERLDGSGYPHGLKGDQIGLPGRILGVADVFCARTAPRVYRDQITTGQALYHLAGNPQRYDAGVVSALVGVVAKGGGRTRPELAAPVARIKPNAA
jgi:HD domain/PAS fold